MDLELGRGGVKSENPQTTITLLTAVIGRGGAVRERLILVDIVIVIDSEHRFL